VTLAGCGEEGFVQGQCTEAKFDCPTNLAMDPSGAILVVDFGNQCIRRIARGFFIVLNILFQLIRASFGLQGWPEPGGLAVTKDGTVFVGASATILELNPQGRPKTLYCNAAIVR